MVLTSLLDGDVQEWGSSNGQISSERQYPELKLDEALRMKHSSYFVTSRHNMPDPTRDELITTYPRT